jgi:hypothetical protein
LQPREERPKKMGRFGGHPSLKRRRKQIPVTRRITNKSCPKELGRIST